MSTAEIETESRLWDAVSPVASTLRPGTMVRRPPLRASLLPGIVTLPAALPDPSLLLLPRSGLLLRTVGLSLRLLWRLLWRLLPRLWITLLLRSRLLSTRLFWLPRSRLRLDSLRLTVLPWTALLAPLRRSLLRRRSRLLF